MRCKKGFFHKWHILDDQYFESGWVKGKFFWTEREIKKICKKCHLVIDNIAKRKAKLKKIDEEDDLLRKIAKDRYNA